MHKKKKKWGGARGEANELSIWPASKTKLTRERACVGGWVMEEKGCSMWFQWIAGGEGGGRGRVLYEKEWGQGWRKGWGVSSAQAMYS